MVLKVGVAAPHKRREDSTVQYLNAPCLTAAINTAVWWLCRHLWSMYQDDLVPSFRRQTFTLIQTTNSTWICPIRPETSSLNGAEGQFHFWEMAASFRYAPWICIWESESDQVISLPAAASTATHSHGAASNGSSIFSDRPRCLWGEHKLARNIPLSLAT